MTVLNKSKLLTALSGGARDYAGTAAVLPDAAVYEAEYQYWPWGKLISWVAEFIVQTVPENGAVFDYMCGTGYLLAAIRRRRPDLHLLGCDINPIFVDHAHQNHREIDVRCADARLIVPDVSPDLIVCTGGLHHLQFQEQDMFLAKLRDECGSTTRLLIGEEVIGSERTESGRRLAVLRLSSDLIEYGIQNDWPAEQFEAAIEVLKNDLFLRGEYKRSTDEWSELISESFAVSKAYWTWRAPSGGGDVVYVCDQT